MSHLPVKECRRRMVMTSSPHTTQQQQQQLTLLDVCHSHAIQGESEEIQRKYYRVRAREKN